MPLSGGSSDPEGRLLFAEQLRRAVEASPRVELAKVASLLWRAYAVGQVSEDQASELSEMIEARRALPAAPKPIQRRLGSRPRSSPPRWSAAGAGPPQEPWRQPWPPGSPWLSNRSWPLLPPRTVSAGIVA